MWGFGKITNDTDQIVVVGYAVGGGTASLASELNQTRGNGLVSVGDAGVLYFTDAGQQSGGPHPWAVDIQAGVNAYRWWYDGLGALDVALEVDHSFVLTGQGQTIQGKLTSLVEGRGEENPS